MRDKLIELLDAAFLESDANYGMPSTIQVADHLIANGVTVQEHCYKAESVISKTGLMCTACHSDIDCDAVFCKYCGAKVVPQPPNCGADMRSQQKSLCGQNEKENDEDAELQQLYARR